jgi:hypothetical protein
MPMTKIQSSAKNHYPSAFNGFFLLMVTLFLLTSTPLKGELWQTYTTADSDLPSNSVLSLAIADNGIKWIGTSGGLARFDETDWTIYTTMNSELPNNTIRCLAIDDMGSIWIGTNSGLAVYDGISNGQNSTGSWRGWTVYDMNNSPLPRNVVSAIAIDENNTVWIGTLGGGGLASFNGTDWQVYTSGNSELPNNFIYTLHIDSNDLLWIGTNFGAASFNGTDWTVFNTGNSPLPDNNTRSLASDLLNRIYIGTNNGGLAQLDGSLWTIYHQNNSLLPENHIKAVASKENGIVWFGTANSGLLRRNNTVISLYDQANSGLSNNSINAVTIEGGQRKWIGTEGGLVSFDLVSVNGIEVEPDSLLLQTGTTYQLSASVTPEEADNEDYYWYSGNESLAFVDETGFVTALDTGLVTIFAVSNDGGYASGCLLNITGTVTTPIFSPPAGAYEGSVLVSILVETEDAIIKYTLDGSDPDENSPVYSQPIFIETTTVISARGYKEHWTPSPVAVAEYEIYTATGEQTDIVQDELSCRVFPNPIFLTDKQRHSGIISFAVFHPVKTNSRLQIYDIRGRKIKEEKRKEEVAGFLVRDIILQGYQESKLASGIYFYRYQTDETSVSGKFTVIR